MSKDYTTQPRTAVRRQDRAVEDDDWIRILLERAAVGVLATEHERQPFVNTNLFVYDAGKHAIYMHTAGRGRTRANLENNPRACFTVYEMGRLLPADVALEFSVEYASAVCFGEVQVISAEDEAAIALQMLLDKYFPHLQPGQDYRPPVPEELKITTVLQMNIEEWSGKRKQVEADFPGAFIYGEGAAKSQR
ncbi:MAG: pyridoxamine 5'-phosphate oxidase family protein [Caldilineales bacterium]|nr:pyridoxamine 5'-phosphate oxidase family protein [Caldilineales bacterium]